MRDISELDDEANAIKVCLRKSQDMKDSAGKRLLEVRAKIQSGDFAPAWTFERWCKAKCSISVRHAYRLMNIAGPVQAERKPRPGPRQNHSRNLWI